MMRASSTTLYSSQIRATSRDGGGGEEASTVQPLCGNSSALFLTAAVQNLPCLKLAEELGVVIANPWVSWSTQLVYQQSWSVQCFLPSLFGSAAAERQKMLEDMVA
ncbi:hypothetical protein Bca4012_067286 [Brassica carinata]|uniref:Uncharacterized protein n=1 Tax=Brassica carinata TaxID=52824 RepID=A0A8X8AZM6_BRACI|nr:hypothetical protein Bca52824_019524 [Brassica carinata]